MTAETLQETKAPHDEERSHTKNPGLTKRLNVILNDRVLFRPLTGVGYYVKQLLHALQDEDEAVTVRPFLSSTLPRPKGGANSVNPSRPARSLSLADRVRWYEREFDAGLRRTHRFIAASEFTKREMTTQCGGRWRHSGCRSGSSCSLERWSRGRTLPDCWKRLPDWRQQWKERSLRRAAEFSRQRCARQTIACYQTALQTA